jgi:hypothetical protein
MANCGRWVAFGAKKILHQLPAGLFKDSGYHFHAMVEPCVGSQVVQ